MTRKTLVVALIIGSLLLSGCELVEQRFMAEPPDERIIANAVLEQPASRINPFTFEEGVTLVSGGSTTAKIGFFNAQPSRKIYIGSGDDSAIDYARGGKHTVQCEGDNGYDYTLLVESPTVEVSAFGTKGVIITITDDHGLAATELSCDFGAVDAGSGFIAERGEGIITIIEE